LLANQMPHSPFCQDGSAAPVWMSRPNHAVLSAIPRTEPPASCGFTRERLKVLPAVFTGQCLLANQCLITTGKRARLLVGIRSLEFLTTSNAGLHKSIRLLPCRVAGVRAKPSFSRFLDDMVWTLKDLFAMCTSVCLSSNLRRKLAGSTAVLRGPVVRLEFPMTLEARFDHR
jgi:hypothetical protein